MIKDHNKFCSNKMKWLVFFSVILVWAGCSKEKGDESDTIAEPESISCYATTMNSNSIENGDFIAFKTNIPLTIDGCGDESTWQNSEWYDLNYIWMGNSVDSSDYYGRFKVSWNEDFLYLLVEVEDNVLHPTLEDGLENYWKGDYVELFIDEDQSGGNHQFNHQAFAYHVSTEGHAIDKNTLQETVFFDEHIQVERINEGNKYSWEMAISLYDSNFNEDTSDNVPVTIESNKVIGFSLAYGDNDGNASRENFMGSKLTHGINNDEGYVNSDVFGSLIFIE